MGDQVKVHKKLYKSGKMWVAAALVAGGALLAVPQSADASVGPMIFPNTHWTVGNTSVSLQQDGKYDTFQYAGSRMYLSIYNQKTYKTTGSKYINVTFSNVASRTDANGHKVYVQRGYVTVAGKKVAVYRGVTKGYNGKLVVINGQMTTTKPNVKTLSALAYKQGAYYDATDRSGQWHLNESMLTVKASAKNATIYNSYNGGVASKLTGFAGKTYRSYSYVYGKSPAVYANAVGKYYTPVAKGKWQLESYYGLTYKTGNVYKYALVPSSKLVLNTSKTVAKESFNATMSYMQSQAADYAKAATSMVSYVSSAVKNGEHPASYGAWADSYASYANSLTGKNTDYTYAVSMAKKNGQNISSYTKAISASKTQTTNAVSKVKSLLANAKKYPVTIRYMYANGKSAGTDVKKSLYYADRLNFTIPAKAGFYCC
ncbi:KxYKxGKxW signal peptide domain-containing protein [Weissella cibaria]|uniref:KxYKxGKxW signal peptide domain-containing protein n=1 Tax=Weissella cibaria TaxID=137591 RepID=UPI001CC79730|nr:KxYKxGKxW signal peptide domain-containing protein [Weissella cibaria]MBZ6070626.1 KxYKxGKxW signal peptide domain-containing protein [Weissella cibaria]